MNFIFRPIDFVEKDYKRNEFGGDKQIIRLMVSPNEKIRQDCKGNQIPVFINAKYISITGDDWNNGPQSNYSFVQGIDNSSKGSKVKLLFQANQPNATLHEGDKVELCISSSSHGFPVEKHSLIFFDGLWCEQAQEIS